jgi:hypothetical protein
MASRHVEGHSDFVEVESHAEGVMANGFIAKRNRGRGHAPYEGDVGVCILLVAAKIW